MRLSPHMTKLVQVIQELSDSLSEVQGFQNAINILSRPEVFDLLKNRYIANSVLDSQFWNDLARLHGLEIREARGLPEFDHDPAFFEFGANILLGLYELSRSSVGSDLSRKCSLITLLSFYDRRRSSILAGEVGPQLGFSPEYFGMISHTTIAVAGKEVINMAFGKSVISDTLTNGRNPEYQLWIGESSCDPSYILNSCTGVSFQAAFRRANLPQDSIDGIINRTKPIVRWAIDDLPKELDNLN